MRRQRVPLGKAAWATRWVSSGIERAGFGWSDMGRWSRGSPVRWSGTSPSAPDLRITPWERGRWNSPPVSLLGLPQRARKSEIQNGEIDPQMTQRDADESNQETHKPRFVDSSLATDLWDLRPSASYECGSLPLPSSFSEPKYLLTY